MFSTFLGQVNEYFGKAFIIAVWMPLLVFAGTLFTVYFVATNSLAATWQKWILLNTQAQLVLGFIFLIVITLIAFIIHYLQVPISRFFEGYWSKLPLLSILRSWKCQQYKCQLSNRWQKIEQLEEEIPVLEIKIQKLEKEIFRINPKIKKTRNIKYILKRQTKKIDKIINRLVEIILSKPNYEFLLRSRLKKKKKFLVQRTKILEQKRLTLNQLVEQQLRGFPPPGLEHHIMPTRLGNIYKSAELYAWDRYQAEPVILWTRIQEVLPKTFIQRLEEFKIATDFLLLSSLLFILFSLATIPYLIVCHAELYLIILCFLGIPLGRLAYEAALVPALAYTELIKVAYDLYRRPLIELWGLELPPTIKDEKELWKNLSEFIYRGFPLPEPFTFVTPKKDKNMMNDQQELEQLKEDIQNTDQECFDNSLQTPEDTFVGDKVETYPVNQNNEIISKLDSISQEISSLKQIFENRLSYDKTKEQAFDNLYTELEELKRNSVFENSKPLYLDLILLFDRIENIRSYSEQLANNATTNTSNILETLRDELLEILYRRGIEIIETDSSIFNREVQRAIQIKTTENIDENNQVAKVVRKGFKYQNRILRAEEVIVKKCQK